jgi:hypothetical protein
MNKQETEFVKTLLGKTLAIPADEAASLLFDIKEDGSGELKDGVLQVVLDKDAARVQKLKDAEKTAFDNGYKKSQGEALSKFEKDLKEKFAISTDKQGIDLIEFVVTEKLKASGGELDDEKIKKSSPYLKMVDQLKQEKDAAVKAETDKFNELNSKIQKESTFSEVSKAALEVITGLNPILPNTKEKADAQIKRFMKDLGDEYGFEVKDGKILILKDGKVLEDKHGHMVEFKDIVKSMANERWDFAEGEPRKGTGNSNDDSGDKGGNKGGYKGPIPKNDTEYMDLIGKAKDDNERIQITEAWTANQKQ